MILLMCVVWVGGLMLFGCVCVSRDWYSSISFRNSLVRRGNVGEWRWEVVFM